MSAGDPLIRSVLLTLARASPTTEIPFQQLLHETSAPPANVHAALETLHQRGCLIERTPTPSGPTLRLVSTPILCWSDLLEDFAQRQNLRLGRRVLAFAKTTSTNDIAADHAADENADGLVIVADEQTAGRGRLGHHWLARPEQSALLSILLCASLSDSIDRLTLLAGLATAEAIEHATRDANPALPHPDIQIKWPNDLLIAGKKLAGILVEHRPPHHLIVGIGINIAQTPADFEPAIASRATSLYQCAGILLDRFRIVAALLQHLDGRFRDPTDAWIDAWKSRCPMLGQRIQARIGPRKITGQILDISPLEGLLLRDDTGTTQFLSAQTTSIDPHPDP